VVFSLVVDCCDVPGQGSALPERGIALVALVAALLEVYGALVDGEMGLGDEGGPALGAEAALGGGGGRRSRANTASMDRGGAGRGSRAAWRRADRERGRDDGVLAWGWVVVLVVVLVVLWRGERRRW
jgi:hypothetical protein